MTEAGDELMMRSSVDTQAWLLAGLVAITVNTVMLALAAKWGLDTGNGVLLRLIRPWMGPMLDRTALAPAWECAGLPRPGSQAFMTGFHLFIGIVMAMAYGYGERLVDWRPWVKGVVYAVVIYAINALVVFPLLGEGIAGSRELSGFAQAFFALAHTGFFVILAMCYARLRRSRYLASK